MSEYLPQDIDLLDFLRTKLGDLSGFGTLANELIQNAEDAKASEITFTVTAQGLIVQNDSEFSEDDFKRMQKIAGGDRRSDEWTIGKFGIGFTSVYLITDTPQIISSGKHWIFRPEQTASQRIEQKKIEASLGTTFLLPWVNTNSFIRQKLNLVPITTQLISQFVKEVEDSLSKALLFLENLTKITLIVGDESISVVREYDNERILIKFLDHQRCITEEQGWYLLHGDFSQNATLLRKEYGENNIPLKRKTTVTIAIPENDQNLKGLLFAFLPTQEESDLPLHVNADFFPSSDRKRISCDHDYRGQWNWLAGHTGILTISKNLEYLKNKLGHNYLWKIISECHKTPQYWQIIKQEIPNSSIILTTNNNWCQPHQVFLLKEFEKEKEAISIFTEVGLSIVHKDLNKYSSLLISSDIKVKVISIQILTTFLVQAGLNRIPNIKDAPQWIQSTDNRNILGKELDILLHRKKDYFSDFPEIKVELAKCAIALGHDSKLYPINNLYPNIQQSMMQLFFDLETPFVFLSADNPESIKKIIIDYKLSNKVFNAEAVMTALENMPISKLQQQLQKPNMLRRLFQFFSEHQKRFLEGSVKQRLCNLAIFPSGGQLLPLKDLLVPGSFNDPLHLASLVDMKLIGEYQELLINLGAQELTLIKYVRDLIPSALKEE
ncbi:MAG: sacsin N-terminal ATP-binding-like domain-containing protein [Nostoc sp.]